MRKKTQESDGDRSHIPREERSYVEYHPTLLTHIALTLVRQATTQHKRAGSRRQSGSQTNGRHSLLSNSNAPTLTGPTKDAQVSANALNTPTASVASNDMREALRDELYAYGQITANEVGDSLTDMFEEKAGNLFEIDPSLALEGAEGSVPLSFQTEMVMDPAFFADTDEIAASPQKCDPLPATDESEARALVKPSVSERICEQTPVAAVSNGFTKSSAILSSDRFLRSEVSVEEKYERLRREEGFSIGKLNEPTFRKLDNSVFEHKVKLTSNAIAFGYQANRPYELTSHAYIRSMDLSEFQLADRVEYDMDEQDEYWLQLYNERRKSRDGDTISREIFEITLTKIEKEWTTLEKKIPKVEKKEDATSEDAKCAICDDGECENTNAIVFCDGCNLAVHQECYGVPYIPEGQWLCRKCFASPIDPVACLFCPSKQGAFKQTSDLHWAHLLCTNWIPEVTVGNPVFMEPIEGVANIPPSRWKLTCYICKLKVGACIQCSNKMCYTSFHVSCARRAKLFLQQNPGNLHSAGKSFCDKHIPDWYRAENDVDAAFAEAQTYMMSHADPRTQSLVGSEVPSRGKFVVSLKRSKQSAVIPAVVFDEIFIYMQKFRIRNKAEFIADLCKYWSLKRRSRRGASLLKRLQLQVEDNAIQKMNEDEKIKRLDFAKILLSDLDNYLKPLFEDIMEREMLKTEMCHMRDEVVERIYLPLQPILQNAIATVHEIDSSGLLHLTGTTVKTLAPDRLTWSELCAKVDSAQYLSVAMFETDLFSTLESILTAYPENLCRENKLVSRIKDRLSGILSSCRLQERSSALGPASMTATCFDADFEPDGLILTEEKPYDWALRDASPLSDLDDAELERLAAELASPLLCAPAVNMHPQSEISTPPRKSHISESPTADSSLDRDLEVRPKKGRSHMTVTSDCPALGCVDRPATPRTRSSTPVAQRGPARRANAGRSNMTARIASGSRPYETRNKVSVDEGLSLAIPPTPIDESDVGRSSRGANRLSRSAAREVGVANKRKAAAEEHSTHTQPAGPIKRLRRHKV